MREHPDLEQLKRQAKKLLDAFLAGEPDAVAEVNAHYRDADPETLALHHAQLALARTYGFQSWARLKACVDGITAAALKEAIRAGDLESVRSMLQVRPGLIHQNLSGIDDRPIHHAVLERKPDIVRLLMEHGANARAGMHLAGLNSNDPSAFDISTERCYDDIAGIIRDVGRKRPPEEPRTTREDDRPRIPDELSSAWRAGDEDRAIAIMRANPALVHAHRDGVTPLAGPAAGAGWE